MTSSWVRLGLLGFFLLVVACAPRSELLDSPIVDELRAGWDQGSVEVDHSTYEALLQDFVDPEAGTVDYQGLSERRTELESYLGVLAGLDLTTIGRDEQLALLINAYNAYTLWLILENYPGVESIRDLSNPWTTERYAVGGYTLSLDQIEHGLIRPLYLDERIHFVVNCAAVDCPHLADFAFTGAEIEAQLEERTRAILRDPKFLRVEGDRLMLPKVMDWYSRDFLSDEFRGAAASLQEYVRPYVTDEVRAFIDAAGGTPRMGFLEYNWALNDVR